MTTAPTLGPGPINGGTPAAAPSNLITRRIWQLSILSLCISGTAPLAVIASHRPHVVILSSGPHSVHALATPSFPDGFLDYATADGVHVLHICYGIHLIVEKLGKKVTLGEQHEYGKTEIAVEGDGGSELFGEIAAGESQTVWMIHGDEVPSRG